MEKIKIEQIKKLNHMEEEASKIRIAMVEEEFNISTNLNELVKEISEKAKVEDTTKLIVSSRKSY